MSNPMKGDGMSATSPASREADAIDAYERLRASSIDMPEIRGIEIGFWTTVAASTTDHATGVETVNEAAIGKQKWTISIPVHTKDEAMVLAAALGGSYGSLASFRHHDCRFVVHVEREVGA